MASQAKPLSRQELQKLLVTDADAWTALRFLRHREQTPAVMELERVGEESLPGFAGVMADLYHVLWSQEPRVRDEVPADRRYWANILSSAMATSAYEEAHAHTQLSDLKSILGTITMGESVIKMVSEEDREKLGNMAEARRDAERAEADAAQAEAEANAAEMLAQVGMEAAYGGHGELSQVAGGNSQSRSPSEQPQSGSGGMTAEEAQARANELAEQANEARAKAEAARQRAEEAQAREEALADELLGKPGSEEAAQKLQELARIGITAAQTARHEVEEVSETLDAWGLEEAELFREGIPEAMGILERMKNSNALKQFAKLLGRIKKIAARKARSKEKSEGLRISKPETGRDIRRAMRSELVALASGSPALRVPALMRWSRGELRLVDEQAKRKKGEGPVVVCEDSSGSMDGRKQMWAKAVVLAFAHYAKLRKRSFAWIMFDSAVQKSKVYTRGRLSAKDLLEIAESRSGGGTDFELPLERALEVIRDEGMKKADIAFITDGDCAVSNSFLEEFGAEKKRMEVSVFTILCDVGHTSDSAVAKFSDRIEQASSFSADEAEAVFNNL